MNKKLNILIGIMFLMLVLPIVSAATTYTPSTTTTCDGGICTQTIYSGTQFVFEDNKWKDWKDAKSLKDVPGFEIQFLENDKDYLLEVVDFNANSITVNLNPKGLSIFSKDVPVRIWNVKDETSLQSDFKNTYDKVIEEEIDFWLLNQEERVTYNFGIGDILEFGPESTTIVLQTAGSENKDDSYAREDFPTSTQGSSAIFGVNEDTGEDREAAIKFIITSIPSDIEIINATLSLRLDYNQLSGIETLDISARHLYNAFSWDEENLDWDNRPSSGTNYNATAEDTTLLSDPSAVGDWFNWTVRNMVLTDYLASNSEVSIYLTAVGVSTDDDDAVFFSTKEDDPSSYRPKLFIVYKTTPEPYITYPLNITYFTDITFFNWTITNYTELDTCLYSLNDATNVSVGCTTNGTYITSTEGSNNILFWVNNTAGNFNSTSITYIRDLPTPEVNITHPRNISYTSLPTYFNWTIQNHTFLDKCWYSLNGASNVTIATCLNNGTYITSTEGSNNIFFWANNTVDEVDSDNTDFFVDSINPSIDLVSPDENYYWYGQDSDSSFTTYLNWTSSDGGVGLSNCWYSTNSTSNMSLTCGDNVTLILDYGIYDISVYVNDTLGNYDSSTINVQYGALVNNSESFNASTYETSREPFTLNFTYPSAQFTDVAANLFYDNHTEVYAGALTGAGDNRLATASFDIPDDITSTLNKDFYWEVNLTNATSTYSYNISHQYQETKNITFIKCGVNPSYDNVFLNYSFKDEDLDTPLQATVSSSTFDYWLGNGDVKKQYVYSNAVLNSSYAFCAFPNKTFHNTINFVYTDVAGGYSERVHDSSDDLSNTTTNTVLYLLGTGGTTQSSILVVDVYTNPIEGVLVKIERQYGGVWIQVSSGTTDSAGVVTFSVNVNYDYKYTLTHANYDTRVVTLRPTQAIYTIILSGEETDTNYVPDYLNINYNLFPLPGTVLSPKTVYVFNFNITSNKSNLDSYSFDLLLGNGTILNTSSGTTAAGSNLTIYLNTSNYESIIGRYYIDIGNGTQQITMRTWTVLQITPGDYSIFTWFDNLGMEDMDIEGKFTGYFIFFLILFVSVAGLTKITGMDLASPGIALGIVLAMVWIASFGSFFNLVFSASDFINKYGIALVVTFLSAGFTLGQLRKT